MGINGKYGGLVTLKAFCSHLFRITYNASVICNAQRIYNGSASNAAANRFSVYNVSKYNVSKNSL